MKRLRIWAVCYAAALTAFTAYLALDTFVLSDAYETDATEMNLSLFSEESAAADSVSSSEERSASASGHSSSGRHSRSAAAAELSSDGPAVSAGTQSGSYQDENISVTLSTYYEYDTYIYVADVQLSSVQYLKTAFANGTYGKNVTAKTSETAAENGAILAVNGDYYGVQESGYVIRNGIVYRGSSNGKDLLCIYADGSMQIVNSDEKTAEELAAEGVWQALCFGPGLLSDGTVTVSQTDEVGTAMTSNPRTAIGMIEPLHYVFVVSDGRTSESAGLSLYELAQFMQSLGVTTAYNLDGGGSSTMYFDGNVVNNPTTTGNRIKERGVSDIVYIG